MPYLEHKDYVDPTSTEKVVTDVKQKIRDFVGQGRRSYESIIKHVQKTDNLTNDDILKQIKEVATEDTFKKPITEEVQDVKIISK